MVKDILFLYYIGKNPGHPAGMQQLARLLVDVFAASQGNHIDHHLPDPSNPLEEAMDLYEHLISVLPEVR